MLTKVIQKFNYKILDRVFNNMIEIKYNIKTYLKQSKINFKYNLHKLLFLVLLL